MVRISDLDIAYRVFRALELGRFVYYLQEFVPHGQRDIRAFVIGGRVEAAMERLGDGWKTNVSQGARVRPLEVDNRLEAMALRAAQAVGTDYAGVDILPLEGGEYVVVEINGIPGWRGLEQATGITIADRLVDYALREIA
jgi:RimK family alpha-L-glutamate ligase